MSIQNDRDNNSRKSANPFTAPMPKPSWTAYASAVLGLICLGIQGCFTVQLVIDLFSSEFRIASVHFTTFIGLLSWIAIILGGIMGHRGLKANVKQFAKPGLFLLLGGIAGAMYWWLHSTVSTIWWLVRIGMVDFIYYNISHLFGVILLPTLILGVFFGHNGLKTSGKKVAKIGLLFCWITCWLFCLRTMFWLFFALLYGGT